MKPSWRLLVASKLVGPMVALLAIAMRIAGMAAEMVQAPGLTMDGEGTVGMPLPPSGDAGGKKATLWDAWLIWTSTLCRLL